MSIFKRISATVFSQVDRAVSEIENHDAIINAAIQDNQRALAKAKSRCNRLQSEGKKLARRLAQLKVSERQWSERAATYARQDEGKALKCLQRRRDCQRQIANLEHALEQQHSAEQRMVKDIASMEARLKEIHQQRNLLRTRQSTAEAMRTFQALEGCCASNIDDTFEKWEGRIMEAELCVGDLDSTDDFEQSFVESEELDDLKAELQDLIADREKRHDC